MENKKKTTKNVIGQVYNLIQRWQSQEYLKTGKTPEVYGIIFSNEGAKGRPPLFDASKSQTGGIRAYWEDESKGWICISAPEPGYEIKAPKSLRNYFSKQEVYNPKRKLVQCVTYLDVSHLNVSKTTDFKSCFEAYGYSEADDVAELKGLETWDVKSGSIFRNFFTDAFPFNKTIELDLSSWEFRDDGIVDLFGFFWDFAPSAQNVYLNLGWKSLLRIKGNRMFSFFACNAENVKIDGIENWNIGYDCSFNAMFENFVIKSNYFLDLSQWSKEYCVGCPHHSFSDGTFFRIKEPKWYRDIF